MLIDVATTFEKYAIKRIKIAKKNFAFQVKVSFNVFDAIFRS